MRAPLVLLLVAGLGFTTPCISAPDSPNWLLLTRSELVNVTVGSISTEALKIETLDEYIAQIGAGAQSNPTIARRLEGVRAELGKALPPGDTVWFASNPAIPLMIVMAGNGEHIHSLRVTVPVVNYSEAQNKRVFDTLGALFKRIYPGWADAEKWPQDSLRDAWSKSPLVTRVAPANSNDQIVRKTLDGVTSATFGVPPDIVVYTVTTLDKCIPDIGQGNPFQRIIC